MANNAFFQARTTQRANLIRAYPHLDGNPLSIGTGANGNPLLMNSMPLGVVKAHSLEVTVARRYSNGLSANFAFSANDVTENRIVEAYDREPTEWQPSQDARPFRMSGGAVYEFPFGANKTFLTGRASRARFSAAGRWAARSSISRARCSSSATCSSTATWTASRRTIRKLRSIAMARSISRSPGSTPEGFVTAAAAQPASYQKRAFPFRLDNLRGPGLFLVNTNIVRNFSLGGSRSLQFRLDVQNLFDAVLWSNPTMDPTSTNFGKVTGATNSIMRFFTFVWKVNF